MHTIDITIKNTDSSRDSWRYLTQSPFEITAPVGDSMMNFLANYLGFGTEYVEHEIMTVFINGSPVDDLHTAHVPAEARIGLGAFAPGVAGMTMCRKSPIAILRDEITFSGNSDEIQKITEGVITLLLFNSVMHDKGLEVLQQGIIVPAARLTELLEEQQETVHAAQLDGTPIATGALALWTQKNPQLKIQLRVECA